MREYVKNTSALTIHKFITLFAMVGLLGSLFFSEFMKFPPCVLCWYQRILLYPIAIMGIVAVSRKDRKFYTYVLPLSVIGLIVSVYHNLLYWNLLPGSIIPCAEGISCTTKYFELFGFITIPFMAFVSFAFVTGLAVWSMRKDM